MAPRNKARQQAGNMKSRQQAKLNSQRAQKAPIQPAPRIGPRRQLPPSTQGQNRVGNSSQPWGDRASSGQRVQPVRGREVGRPQLPPSKIVPESRRLPGMQGPQPAPRPQRPGTSRPAAPSRMAAAQAKAAKAAQGTASTSVRIGGGSSSKQSPSVPAKPTPSTGRPLPKGLRALAGTKARAAGTGLSVAGSVLSGDAKSAAITGGTYAAGRALQALPDPRAKLAGKALEFAAPFVPGAASALSSGSAKARPNKTSSGAKTKADLIGGNAPKKPSSFNEKAYASQQKFNVPKSETPKQSAPAKPSPAASRPAAAPNRAPAAAPRMRAPVRRPSAPAPMASKQTGDKAKDMETWRKANPALAKALDERLAKKQSAAALRISGKFDTKTDIYSPSTKVDGSKLDANKIDQAKVSEYRRRKDRYYS
jgi:hypothetical protein